MGVFIWENPLNSSNLAGFFHNYDILKRYLIYDKFKYKRAFTKKQFRVLKMTNLDQTILRDVSCLFTFCKVQFTIMFTSDKLIQRHNKNMKKYFTFNMNYELHTNLFFL